MAIRKGQKRVKMATKIGQRTKKVYNNVATKNVTKKMGKVIKNALKWGKNATKGDKRSAKMLSKSYPKKVKKRLQKA